MSKPHPVLERLFSLLPKAITNPYAKADSLLSITLPLSEWPYVSPVPMKIAGYRYCACPESKRALLGYGAVVQTTAAGADRLKQVQKVLADIKPSWIHIDPDTTGLRPYALLAFAFDHEDTMASPWEGVPNTLLEIPAVLIQQQGEMFGITFTCRLINGRPDLKSAATWREIAANLMCHKINGHLKPTKVTDSLLEISTYPDEQTWLLMAERARQDIHSQVLDKVVLTRHICIQGQHHFEPWLMMPILAERYPGCIQIAIDLSNYQCLPLDRHLAEGESSTIIQQGIESATIADLEPKILIAATPERLVTAHVGNIICEAVAGTAPISKLEFADPSEFGLLDSTKGRHEHKLVVEHIAAVLQEHCTELQIPDQPEILNLRLMRHLRSVIYGRLSNTKTIFDLLEHLHPTPAVGGTPTKAALDWLRTNETTERGWYSGVLGWLTPDGDGEFAVVLRCALLKGAQAHLFAGAGVVGDSEPTAELEEIQLKLQTMLDVLQDV